MISTMQLNYLRNRPWVAEIERAFDANVGKSLPPLLHFVFSGYRWVTMHTERSEFMKFVDDPRGWDAVITVEEVKL